MVPIRREDRRTEASPAGGAPGEAVPQQDVIDAVRANELALLYVAPERLLQPQTLELAVAQASDYAAIAPLDARQWPFSEMLDLIGLVRRDLGPDEVLLMTVFTPMSVALDLAGGPEALAAAVRTDPGAVHRALRAITDTFRDFVRLCLDAGADGLYFATTHAATAEHFTGEQYEEFGRPYDLEVLDEADGAFLNMLHVCKASCYVRELADYPVQAIHWDTYEPSNPTLAEMRFACDGRALAGGRQRRLGEPVVAVDRGGVRPLVRTARHRAAGAAMTREDPTTVSNETIRSAAPADASESSA